MAAKELTIFMPKNAIDINSLNEIAKNLSLMIEEKFPSVDLSYQFSARKGLGKDHLSIYWSNKNSDLIKEILEWERPSDYYKNILAECKESITINYRDLQLAKNLILTTERNLTKIPTSACIVDNGLGCLINFNDFLNQLKIDSGWSWEKEEFPEIAGVAISEWK